MLGRVAVLVSILVALSAFASRARADDSLLPPGGAYHYGFLGTYSTGVGTNAVDIGGLWNYNGLIPGSYGFVINRNWAAEIKAGRNGTFAPIQWFAEPGGGPKPDLPARVGSIVNVTTLFGVSNNTTTRDDTTGVRFNHVLTPAGRKLLGAFPFNPSTGGALNFSVIPNISPLDASFQQITLGVGLTTLVEVKQPDTLTSHLDAIVENVDEAISLERHAETAVTLGSLKRAHEQLKESVQKLEVARDAAHEARNWGELDTADRAHYLEAYLASAVIFDTDAMRLLPDSSGRRKGGKNTQRVLDLISAADDRKKRALATVALVRAKAANLKK
jgi:hypothetical protein